MPANDCAWMQSRKKNTLRRLTPLSRSRAKENVGSKKEHKNILKTLTLESGDDTAESNGNHSAGFRRRVTLGQQGMAACSGIATSFYVLAISTNMEIFRTLTTVFIFSIIVFTPLVLYKNVSTTILLRLLKEPNVVIILTYGVINAIIDIARPSELESPINGRIYMLILLTLMSLDAVRVEISNICYMHICYVYSS